MSLAEGEVSHRSLVFLRKSWSMAFVSVTMIALARQYPSLLVYFDDCMR